MEIYEFVTTVLLVMSAIMVTVITGMWLYQAFNYYVDHGEFEPLMDDNSTNPFAVLARMLAVFFILAVLSYVWPLTLAGVVFWASAHVSYVKRKKMEKMINTLKGE